MIIHRAANRVSSGPFRNFIRGFHLEWSIEDIVDRIATVPSTEVGPGASKESAYKNPEYYCYDKTSYFEAEVAMADFRKKQPSNKTPLVQTHD